MQEIAADLQKLVANLIRRGVIHSLDFGGKIPKAKIEIGDIVTGWLPICSGFNSKNRNDFDPPEIGDPVTILSEGGDLNNGRVYPGANTANIPAPGNNPFEHVTRYEDGTEITYNREIHSLTISIAQNGTCAIIGDTLIDGNVQITKGLIVQDAIRSMGHIYDFAGSMQDIRTTYNGHSHKDAEGRQTTMPLTKMI